MKVLTLAKALGSVGGKMYDFHIDQTPLMRIIERRAQFDCVPRTGDDFCPIDSPSIGILCGEQLDDGLPEGRVALYVCRLCKDYGCGAVTCKVARDGKDIIWDDFAFENDYDYSLADPIERVGPFRFDFDQYKNALENPLIE